MSNIDLGNEDEKDEAAKGVSYSLVSDGDWLFRKGQYQKAIESYTKTLSIRPEDRSCYVGLSKCYLLMGNPQMALKEAENSLRGDESYFEGLYQKAEALYYMGEFEFALVCYHQGQKIRPEIQKFRLGNQKAQEAIENASGCPSSVKLENKGDLSFFQKDNEVRRKYPATAIQQLMVGKKTTTKKTTSEKRDKQILGEFFNDKKYLENLLKDKDLGKVMTKKGESLQNIIKGSLSYLETCTEFRNNVQPIVEQKVGKSSHKEARPNSSSERLQFFLQLEEIESDLTRNSAGSGTSLGCLHGDVAALLDYTKTKPKYLLCGNAKASLKKAEEVMKTVQTWKDVPDKDEFLEMLHRCIGNAHYELGDMDKTMDHYHKGLELAEQCKLHETRSRALDNMGHAYAQMGRFEQAIECQEKRILLVHDPVERTWVFYELGRWHLELNRFEEAEKYGLRSVAAAEDTGDIKWKMNSSVLLAQSELKLGKFKSSISHFEIALSHAKQQDDDTATNAIQEALDEAKQNLPQNEDVQDNA